MSGRYCEKHEEWAPTGECRWCDPAPTVDLVISTGEIRKLHAGNPPPLWPQELAHIPPALRFVDMATGKPKPLIGRHWPSPNRDACALCGKAGMEITQDPDTPCL